MDQEIRVRFAPSPTGPLHIGGVRTALYNYLFAKKHAGKFILRIEDTDQARKVPGAEEYIKEALKWCGLTPDEGPNQGGAYGPYRQSDRKDIYQKYVKELINNGKAYYAFDTINELDAMRQQEIKRGNHIPKYDQHTRLSMKNSLTMSSHEVSEAIEKGVSYTVRLNVPENEVIEFSDVIRDQVSFQSRELDDKVILKADGLPTYHLANVVDDRLMKISHVIRGEEWLSSTAHHVLLYRGFGWEEEMPVFAHLPLILKPTGSGKLSKRDGQRFGFPVFPLPWTGTEEEDAFEGFASYGFSPKAVVNFLALLGWNPGTDQELFSLEELIDVFSIDHVSKAGARFDYDKAKWFNAQYIMKESVDELADHTTPFIEARGYSTKDTAFVLKVCGQLQERIHTYKEVPEMGYYFFEDVREYDQKILRKKWKESVIPKFEQLSILICQESHYKAANIKMIVTKFLEENSLGFGDILPLLRIAISGTTKGPDLFQMMEILGKEKTCNRLLTSPAVFDKLIQG